MKYIFNIEKNNCSDFDELISLSKTYYDDSDITDKNYLKWQYLQNPNGRPYLFTSREAKKGELAGQYLVIPIKFIVDNDLVIGSLSLNTLTGPKFQGMGLFTKMAKATYDECARDDVNFTVGFPNSQSYGGFIRKLGFANLGEIPLLIKPLKLVSIFSSYFKRGKGKHGGEIPLEFENDIYCNIEQIFFDNKNTKNKLDEFWNNIKSNYSISSIKDFQFLNWRYNKIPTRSYKVLSYQKDGKISGIIIIKAEKVWGYRVGLIMDVLVHNNDLNVIRELLEAAKMSFKRQDIDFMAVLHSDNYEAHYLKKLGFFKIPNLFIPQKIHFIFRNHKMSKLNEKFRNLNNWKLTFGDYDIF